MVCGGKRPDLWNNRHGLMDVRERSTRQYMYTYGGYVSIADRPGNVLCVLVAY